MIFEIIVSAVLLVMAASMAYRGIFGLFLWRWTRYPFAIVGSICMTIAMNGVPVPVRREEDQEESRATEREMVAQDLDEPSDEDNQAAKHVWSLKGMTPTDVQNQCVAQTMGSHYPDPEFDEVEFEPRESQAEFKARRAKEKVA